MVEATCIDLCCPGPVWIVIFIIDRYEVCQVAGRRKEKERIKLVPGLLLGGADVANGVVEVVVVIVVQWNPSTISVPS